MAASSWMLRNRSLLSGRPRNRVLSEDVYMLDNTQSPAENMLEIFRCLCSRGVSDGRRLGLLNALVTLAGTPGGLLALGFTLEDALCCLRVCLVHDCTQVRAGAMRAIRHIMIHPEDVKAFNNLQLPHLVSRCLDVVLKNEMERIQSLKLVRRVLVLSPEEFSQGLARSVVALGMGGGEQGDRLLRACLATLCEIGVLNPSLLISCGGIGVILQSVLECQRPRIAESLIGVLLHMLERPETRYMAGIRLEMLAAPYCDFHYRLGIMDKNKDARDLRFTCSRLALLSVLRSWAGTLQFCHPDKSSGLSSIVSVLYLNQLEVRKAVLDLLYELLGLPQPAWTDEYSVALAAVDPSDLQDNWRLNEGFVAAEGRNVLPSLANHVPNTAEMHLALLLYCFLESGLLAALVEVIVTSDTFISVRATILLGKLLHLMHILLPPDVCDISPALPNLLLYATQNKPQALAAVAVLQNLHTMLKRRPASASLFLDQILLSGTYVGTRFKVEDQFLDQTDQKKAKSTNDDIKRCQEANSLHTAKSHEAPDEITKMTKKNKLFKFFAYLKEVEGLLRVSNVLHNQDGATWNWDIIGAILKNDHSGTLLDDPHLRFLRRLVQYFKPSSNRFSHQDLGHGRHPPDCVLVGADLVEWLVQSTDSECSRMLWSLLTDIASHLTAISTSRSAHDCLFSPQHMQGTLCQMYFLYVGRLCRYEKGLDLLQTSGIAAQLLHLITTTNHACYIKLIISGLDYSLDAFPRQILAQTLSSPIIASRLYATQFLLVLLRSGAVDFPNWGLNLLIKQIRDSDTAVSLTAIEILNEACHEKIYLTNLVSLWPSLTSLGDPGRLLWSRFFSTEFALERLGYKIITEIQHWVNTYNKQYVLIVESDTHSILTQHSRNADGSYGQRMSMSSRNNNACLPLPPHVYGQLVQTQRGFEALLDHGDLQGLLKCISASNCSTEFETLLLKSALWAVGHTATNKRGIDFLLAMQNVFERIVDLAQICPVYSVRASAFYVLGLIGTTFEGANVLYKLGWLCVRHQRNEQWPIVENEDWQHRSSNDEMSSNTNVSICGSLKNRNDFANSDVDNNIIYEKSSDISIYQENKTCNVFLSQSGDSNNSLLNLSSDDNESFVRETRSKTLPQSLLSSRTSTYDSKHIRSLSESKPAGSHIQTNMLPRRFRYYSGTDSNTSGISSCDSVLAKLAASSSEKAAPLSPIPSSTLLNVSRTASPMNRPERSRKISLPSTTIDLGAFQRYNPLSQRDLHGYATLRSLGQHRRPFCSESNTDDLMLILRGDTFGGRSLKVRSLDRHNSVMSWKDVYDWSTSCIDGSSSNSLSIQCTSSNTPFNKYGPCYIGISLPKNLNDLFTSEDLRGNCSVNDGMCESAAYNELLIRVSEKLKDEDSQCSSRVTEGSVMHKEVMNKDDRTHGKWFMQHDKNTCLLCCRLHQPFKKMYNTESLDDQSVNKNSDSSSLNLSLELSLNTPESVFSDEIHLEKVIAMILKHIQRMANPVWYKQSKHSLLELKQKYPHAFQDICLYSEMCKSVSCNTYRLCARRFLQELFLDLNFDSFYSEPNAILDKVLLSEPAIRLCELRGFMQTFALGNENTAPSTEKTLGTEKVESPLDLKLLINDFFIPSGTNKNFIGPLRSPPLESVREMSRENLYDSSTDVSSASEFNNRPLINNLGKIKLKKDDIKTRTNTKSLDLSCTKNKFPITRRVSQPTKYLISPSSSYATVSLTVSQCTAYSEGTTPFSEIIGESK